jgi:anti-sigma regulatory factor (Ser/Thr protein kinase)
MAWLHDFAPLLELPKNVMGIVEHGFTEMVNNANDHSLGSYVTAAVRIKEGRVALMVMDNGIGIFAKISNALALPDPRLAILELSKGKFTTDPTKHSGEGIFFTSRMFDHFDIEANDLRYDHDVREQHDWLVEIPQPATGTVLYMSIPTNSSRTKKEVFDNFSGGDDYGFHKTVVPVRLAKIGNENLVSRSQAKRLVARFEGFRTVLLDFAEVDEIGQAFADEIFRVFTTSHPNTDLVPVNAIPEVQQMIVRAQMAPQLPLPGPMALAQTVNLEKDTEPKGP